jgi:hypothetical protein
MGVIDLAGVSCLRTGVPAKRRDAMTEDVVSPEKSGPKNPWSMQVAVTVMIVGGALILIPWFLTVEEGTTAYYLKVAVGMVGFVTLCLGAYKRP